VVPLPGEDTRSYEWSCEAIEAFNRLYREATKNKPDILAIDGMSSLAVHLFNKVTGGELLAIRDLSLPQAGEKPNQYRAAKFYRFNHDTVHNYCSMWYYAPVPLLIATCWERWVGADTAEERRQGIQATRYLWCDFPGDLATFVPSKFDVRLSARFEQRCYHHDPIGGHPCPGRAGGHYVWQFLPKEDVRGVGIKGLVPTARMQSAPWIHQSGEVLEDLITAYAQGKVIPVEPAEDVACAASKDADNTKDAD